MVLDAVVLLSTWYCRNYIYFIYILPTNADKKMQVFLAQKCKSVFIQNQPQFGKFLNKDLNLIRIKIE